MSASTDIPVIARATLIYARCGMAKVTRHRTGWAELGELSLALRRFTASLGDEAVEDYWSTLLTPLRKFAFLLSATPLPPNDAVVCQPNTAEMLEEQLRNVHSLFPDRAVMARDLVSRFRALANSDSNPVLGEIERVCTGKDMQRTALLLKESRLCDVVEECLSRVQALRGIEVVNTHHLRGDECYDNLIVPGAAGWYPNYVFTAARASEVHIICPRWIRDGWRHEPAFLSTGGEDRPSSSLAPVEQRVSPGDQVEAIVVDDSVNADEMLPKVDFDALLREYARQHGSEPEQEVVDATLFILEGNTAVFIDTADRAKILTIDPEGAPAAGKQTGTSRLKKLLATYVEPGTYILLRTSGSGDYIIPLADKILGTSAERIRGCQSHWKALLREAVSRTDLIRVSLELIDLGSERADENNVRTWMSSRNISPGQRRDFEAIMKLTGLEEKTAEYWANTRALLKAHMKAGFHIRKLLLKQVADADLDELEAAGQMSFEIPGSDAGSLTAYRVLSISDKQYKVLATHIGEPFDYEGETWHE